MNVIQRVLDRLGQRLMHWGDALRAAAREHAQVRADDAPGDRAAQDAPDPDARQRWLQRVAHVPAQAWQGSGAELPRRQVVRAAQPRIVRDLRGPDDPVPDTRPAPARALDASRNLRQPRPAGLPATGPGANASANESVQSRSLAAVVPAAVRHANVGSAVHRLEAVTPAPPVARPDRPVPSPTWAARVPEVQAASRSDGNDRSDRSDRRNMGPPTAPPPRHARGHGDAEQIRTVRPPPQAAVRTERVGARPFKPGAAVSEAFTRGTARPAPIAAEPRPRPMSPERESLAPSAGWAAKALPPIGTGPFFPASPAWPELPSWPGAREAEADAADRRAQTRLQRLEAEQRG